MFNAKTLFLLAIISLWKETDTSDNNSGNLYFLSLNHVPYSYELNLVLDLDHNKFSGQVNITFSTTFQTNSVHLHASPTRITKITRVILNHDHICNTTDSNNNTEIMTVRCSAPIKRGVNRLLIDYEGIFGTNGTDDEYFGFFKHSYDGPEGKENYAGTQFQASYARAAFPCFDEPEFKAEFLITVTHPEDYTVLANTKIKSQMTRKG